MTGVAIFFLCLSIVLVWGGLVASVLFLRNRAELAEYPPGGLDDDRDESQVIARDT